MKKSLFPIMLIVALAGCRATALRNFGTRICAARETVKTGIDGAISGLSSLGGPVVGVPAALLGAGLKAALDLGCAPVDAATSGAAEIIEAPQAAIGIIPNPEASPP